MAEDGGSAFDIVAEGPGSSDAPDPSLPAPADPVGPHASLAALEERFGEAVLRHELQAGDEHVVFVEPSRNAEILGWLRDDPDQAYDLLVDVTAVDYGGGRPIQVVYQLWSVPHRRALRVKCELDLEALTIESVAPIWRSADWLEREVYDLFGVTFRGHPDLRRILMPQNYAEGHPLRKDFPVRGRFSRAEQTRRALSQDYQDWYTEEVLEIGGEPALRPPDPGEPASRAEDLP